MRRGARGADAASLRSRVLIEHDLLRESVPEIESGLGIPRTVRQSSAFVSATPIDHAHSV